MKGYYTYNDALDIVMVVFATLCAIMLGLYLFTENDIFLTIECILIVVAFLIIVPCLSFLSRR